MVDVNGVLRTYGQSDFFPVVFSEDFPETIEDAKARAWNAWKDGFMDLADTLGHEEFARMWRRLKDRGKSVQPGCYVIGLRTTPNGRMLSMACPVPDEPVSGEHGSAS